MNDEKKPVEFERVELERVLVGTTPGKTPDEVVVSLEVSQRVRDDGTLSRPTLAVILWVGPRFVRLGAEPWRDNVSIAVRAGEAISRLALHPGHMGTFQELLREWQADNPLPEKKPREERNDGSANRGLHAEGKTKRKRERQQARQQAGRERP